MKHFWPLTIAAVLVAFTAQAVPLNTQTTSPTLLNLQSLPPTTTSIGADRGGLGSGKIKFGTFAKHKRWHPPKQCREQLICI